MSRSSRLATRLVIFFTYALLDALDHIDVNKNWPIEVSELAD